MKVIQITNRNKYWRAGYRQYYFGIGDVGEADTYYFLMKGHQDQQIICIEEITEIK